MGSDPQYAKYPDLNLAQDIFTLTNASATPISRQESLTKLQNAINDKKMAPLYRYLAHPVDGILNTSGEGNARRPPPRKPNGAPATLRKRSSSVTVDLPWDDQLYEKLKTENDKELEGFQKEEEEAEEKAGDAEVQAARAKRADFWARVCDKVRLMLDIKAMLTIIGKSAVYIRRCAREDECIGN